MNDASPVPDDGSVKPEPESPRRPVDSLDAVMDERRLLVNVGYRLLGSLADAEDAVQETYARWFALSERQRQEIESPTAWLVKVCSRVCLDLLGSARARRERYIGEWLPEPLPDSTRWTSQAPAQRADDPADRVTLDESVTMALLVVFESMTPAERVAFVLHDVFRYSFVEIADIVGRSPQACRQLASSARRRVRSSRSTSGTSTEQHARLVHEFSVAWQTGDLAGLIRILDPDAVGIADGGGLVPALLEPLVGATAIAEFFVTVHDRRQVLSVHETSVNGQPGLVATAEDETIAVLAFDVSDQHITRLWSIRNPEKLRAWR
jgi:RNA polymerase sigma factor (sigma-70 family)